MRKIIVTEFLTVDGVMEDPHLWSFPYWNDDIAKFKKDELFASDALLLGRVTYEGFASAWPDRTDEEGFSDRMNNLSKFVVSSSLQKAEWKNSTIIKDNIAVEVKKLKEMAGQDIMVAGSAKLTQSLLDMGLIDEFSLLVYPLVVGKGKKLFSEANTAKLQLLESRTYTSGVALMRYQVEKKQ